MGRFHRPASRGPTAGRCDFIAFLRSRYRQFTPDQKANLTELGNEAFIGMWRDRVDMEDSSQWVRDLRLLEMRIIASTAIQLKLPLISKNQRDCRFIENLDLFPYPGPFTT